MDDQFTGAEWLLETAGEEGVYVPKLHRLLASASPENAMLALEILRQGGVPAVLRDALLAVALLFPDDAVRAQARALLTGAPEAVRTLLAAQDLDVMDDTRDPSVACVEAAVALPEVDARRFTQMVMHIRPSLKNLHLPYMTTAEIAAHYCEDGFLGLHDLPARPIPAALFELEHIHAVSIAHSSLTELPEGILRWADVRYLSLNYNQLQDLPAGLSRLVALEQLDLASNAFRRIPQVLHTLPQLRSLAISDNPLAILPGDLAQLPALKIFWAMDCGWEEIPSALFEQPGLEELGIGGRENRISACEFPPEFERLRQLQSLYLAEVPLLRLPDCTVDLPLVNLDLTGTLIQELPPEFGRLTALSELNVHRCKHLRALPEDIGGCVGLETLSFAQTQVRRLPESLVALQGLRVIDIGGLEWDNDDAALSVLRQLRGLEVIYAEDMPSQDFTRRLVAAFPHVRVRV